MGKFLILTGISLALLGILVVLAQKSGAAGWFGWFGWFGNLPLDIRIEKENFRFYFPVGSSILISIVLSLIFSIINKLFR